MEGWEERLDFVVLDTLTVLTAPIALAELPGSVPLLLVCEVEGFGTPRLSAVEFSEQEQGMCVRH